MNKHYDFLPNRLNKYSIRKFTVGTASILIGSLLFLGTDVEASESEHTEETKIELEENIEQRQLEDESTLPTAEEQEVELDGVQPESKELEGEEYTEIQDAEV